STLNLMNRNYEGEILFEGKNIVEYQPDILRSKICMVLQEPYLEDANVQEVLDLPLHYSSLKHRRLPDRQERIKNLFTAFQLSYEYLQKPTSQLSVGEKQRIALIRVLQLQPDILLLDEITSALDQKTSGIISECIFNNFAGTVIAISHDPLWQNLWQRNWVLEYGTIIDRRI
ncbi:MAG: ATP-binding cassette domain-containing protein, partial [Candidatus Cloacimonas acidaminovorans]